MAGHRQAYYPGTVDKQFDDAGVSTALTDSSGGTTDGDLEAVAGSGADAAINNNFAELWAVLDAAGLLDN